MPRERNKSKGLRIEPVNGIFLPDSPYYSNTHYPTFDPAINGTSDTVYVNQYREAGQGLGTITLYHDDIRVGHTYNSVAR